LRKTNKQEVKEPRVLGEDFDIFPDSSDLPLDESDAEQEYHKEIVGQAEQPQSVPVEKEAEEDEPSAFEKKIASIAPKTWTVLQIVGGIILGTAGSLCITWLGNTETFKNFGLIFAVVVSLLLPIMFEKYAKRRMQVMRITILISVLIVLAIYFLTGGAAAAQV